MRHYKHKGLELPSVTTILSDCSNNSAPLIQWSANCAVEWIKENCYIDTVHSWCKGCWIVPESKLNKARFAYKDISKQALEVGSAVHSAIEKHLQGQECALTTKEAKSAFRAFLRFEYDYKLEIVRPEFKIYSDYGWAGTADFEGWITVEKERRKYLLDWKCSKNLYREVRIQTAAYRSMTKCTHNGAVRLDKATGEYEFKDYSRFYEADLKEWYSTVRLYFDRHPIIAKKAGI